MATFTSTSSLRRGASKQIPASRVWTDRMLLDTAHEEWLDANSLRRDTWCSSCEEHHVTHIMPSGALLCLLCAVSELEYFHLHGDD